MPQQEGRAKCSTSKLGENSTYEKRLEYKTVSASDQQLCNARRKHCSTGKEFARSEHGAIATAVSRQQTFNRATTVGAGTVILALLVSVSIALGAAHRVENLSEVSGRMTPRKLLRAALVSPAWPWL